MTEAANPEESSDTITPAYASAENRPPEYPPEALKAGCRGGTIPIRVYVGSDGNVVGQKDIPGSPARAGACNVAFLAAAEAAVAHWRFAPAFRLTRAPASGGRRLGSEGPWQQVPIAIYLDFEFRFDLVDGKGVVVTR